MITLYCGSCWGPRIPGGQPQACEEGLDLRSQEQSLFNACLNRPLLCRWLCLDLFFNKYVDGF